MPSGVPAAGTRVVVPPGAQLPRPLKRWPGTGAERKENGSDTLSRSERRHWFSLVAHSLGCEATLSRSDGHFYGPRPTTGITGPQLLKIGKVLAISGNWLDPFVDHLGRERHCVVVNRGRGRGAGTPSWGWRALVAVLSGEPGAELQFEECSSFNHRTAREDIFRASGDFRRPRIVQAPATRAAHGETGISRGECNKVQKSAMGDGHWKISETQVAI